MTKSYAYTVKDTAAEAYLPPFFMQSRGAALRAFADAVKDPQHQFAKHPEDYFLFEMGTFDEQTGIFTPYETLESVARAIDYVPAERNPV